MTIAPITLASVVVISYIEAPEELFAVVIAWIDNYFADVVCVAAVDAFGVCGVAPAHGREVGGGLLDG